MHTTRPAAVAGSFYPDSPDALRRVVDDLLAAVPASVPGPAPKALIVPHAGYIYSGAVAAQAYARLTPLRGRIRRVVLLGPAHRVYVRGLALPEAESFATPLGEVALDLDGMRTLAALPQVTASAAAHRLEHSLEVQLPFLQRVLGDFRLLPLAVGDATGAGVAEVLEAAWGGDETLIVISSDLSHFHSDAEARVLDGRTVEAILALAPHLDHEQACGATPVNGLILAARRHGLAPVKLAVRNSAAVSGDRERVVGYAAFAFVPHTRADQPDSDKGATLLSLARSGIAACFAPAPQPAFSSGWLQQPGASFVTLTRGGALRGCIGTLQAHRPLGDDVRENAVAAAFRDPRFAPLSRAEFEQVRVEVSVLSPSEPLAVANEAEALDRLRPHVDGVVFEYGHARSTFLPQVWEQLPEPADFLAHLKRKAGLAADFWSDTVRLSRYTVTKWKETEASA
ncbi:MAG: AmmeMemoRadiSam system protein B [Pseudomonadota bacterium]